MNSLHSLGYARSISPRNEGMVLQCDGAIASGDVQWTILMSGPQSRAVSGRVKYCGRWCWLFGVTSVSELNARWARGTYCTCICAVGVSIARIKTARRQSVSLCVAAGWRYTWVLRSRHEVVLNPTAGSCHKGPQQASQHLLFSKAL